ncbi:MAG: FKBP-type peptidyl-prolyl cis-trans isomerase [Chitinophagaceae bacterium]|jgi:FKBP-type peptidyl-prolyl cis-trans isomerase|nr:FKBP-type peptidyl-prolyl cis-trans isomerase [Chitinophagaceae bacterium]
MKVSAKIGWCMVICLGTTGSLLAQQKTTAPAKKPATATAKPATTAKPAPAAPVLKTPIDSMSYAIGMLDGNFFKMQGVTEVNASLLGRGFEDMIRNKPLMTPEQADMLIRRELQKMSRKKIQPNIDEGLKFCAENAKRKEVKQTASGLQYEVITEGTGPQPTDTNTVKVHYDGFLLNGKKFDSSRDRGEPTVYPLNQFIRGWVEGIQLMKTGSRYKFYIPYQLAYGEQGAGENIPGGSTLIFDVELIEIVK